MRPDIDIEAQRAAQATPRAGAFFPLSHHRRNVTTRDEEVEGAETREMDDLAHHTSSVASSRRLVPTGQDISDEALPVVSHVEGVTPICYLALLSHPETIVLFYRIRGKQRP